jgi:hypothetical protein
MRDGSDEDKEEDVDSCWMTMRKREDIGIRKK